MPPTNRRIEIPLDIAAMTLFASDRTCCVCNDRRKPIQLHHIDGNPSNSVNENLAVLCLECHHQTQIRGGFDRKLDALQIRLYKQNWLERVVAQRTNEKQPRLFDLNNSGTVGTWLRYVKIEETSDEQMYSFDANYILVRSTHPAADKETNTLIEAYITRSVQRFRANAVANVPAKESQKTIGYAATAWDFVSIAHSVALFTPEVLSLEFEVYSYGAGAAHPNSETKTLNFGLNPSMELEIHNIFKPSTNYLELLSQYCVADLHKQQPQRWHDPIARRQALESHGDQWIFRGAGPEARNFERISFRRNGFVIHFDPYQVGSYAEGKFEVFVPLHVLQPAIEDDVAALLK